jgi:hypothetical protein
MNKISHSPSEFGIYLNDPYSQTEPQFQDKAGNLLSAIGIVESKWRKWINPNGNKELMIVDGNGETKRIWRIKQP